MIFNYSNESAVIISVRLVVMVTNGKMVFNYSGNRQLICAFLYMKLSQLTSIIIKKGGGEFLPPLKSRKIVILVIVELLR